MTLRSKSVWGLVPVKGAFREVTGHGTVTPAGEVSGRIEIGAASVDTGNAKRDKHLRSDDFFLSDNRPGHVALLVFLQGHSPVSVEIVFGGKVISGPKPYGLGFSLDVPLIKVLPDASDASATSAFITLGAHNVAYYRKVNGKRTLFHVKGIVLPPRCPHGGWPVASRFKFQDGSTVLATRSVPCPGH